MEELHHEELKCTAHLFDFPSKFPQLSTNALVHLVDNRNAHLKVLPLCMCMRAAREEIDFKIWFCAKMYFVFATLLLERCDFFQKKNFFFSKKNFFFSKNVAREFLPLWICSHNSYVNLAQLYRHSGGQAQNFCKFVLSSCSHQFTSKFVRGIFNFSTGWA